MARARMALSALLFVLTLGCVVPAATTIPPTEDVLTPLRPTAENTPTEANTPAATATPEATPTPKPPDCLGNNSIRGIRGEYAANPFRARAEYGGRAICLSGEIVEFYRGRDKWGRDMGLVISVRTGEGIRFDLGGLRGEQPDYFFLTSDDLWKWHEWHNWDDQQDPLLAASVGDKIEVECEIWGLADEGDEYEPGTPYVVGCEWANADRYGITGPSQPPSDPSPYDPSETKTLTWGFLLWPGDPESPHFSISIDVPTTWDWYVPPETLAEDAETDMEDGYNAPMLRHLKSPDYFLPFATIVRQEWVYDGVEQRERDLESTDYTRNEIISTEHLEGMVNGTPAILESFVYVFDDWEERRDAVFLRQEWEWRGETEYYGWEVACHSMEGDKQQQAVCGALLASVKVEWVDNSAAE